MTNFPDDDGRGYMACSRLDGSADIFTQGREDVCTECGARVHVSRSSDALIREKELLVICMPCAMPDINEHPEILRRPTPEQLLEMHLYLQAAKRRN